jgi:uncharacterized sulfatase
MQPIEDFLDDVDDDPFMIWYAPFLPHTPHDSPPKYFDAVKSIEGVAPHEIPYFAAIAQFDDTVGTLIDTIEKRGLAENTLFVFVVDNGWQPDPKRFVAQRGEWDHTKKSKRAPFDAGLRTPILFRWDGKTQPATHQELVSSVDLMPTIMAAVNSAKHVDETLAAKIDLPGANLWPAVTTGDARAEDGAVFGELYPGDATVLGDPSRDIAYRWVRQGRYKLIVPHSRQRRPPWNGYLDGTAIFDLVADPNETRNLIEDPKLSNIVQRLTTELDQWWDPAENRTKSE